MHLKWPLMIPGLNLKEERKGEWEGGREREGGKKGRRSDGGEERKKGRDGRRHQLTKQTKKSYSSPCLQLTPTYHPISQCSHIKLFSGSPFRSLLKCPLLTKASPNPTGLGSGPF